jgi:hypothetical protein
MYKSRCLRRTIQYAIKIQLASLPSAHCHLPTERLCHAIQDLVRSWTQTSFARRLIPTTPHVATRSLLAKQPSICQDRSIVMTTFADL